jgi:pimeloyl-ACP methyl ester carboxylesterase
LTGLRGPHIIDENNEGEDGMRALSLGMIAVAGCVGTAAQAAPDCAAMARLALADEKLEITSAQIVPAAPPGTVRASAFAAPIAVPIPAYCKVSGVINRRTGVGGKAYGLGFELALPEGWNGRFLFQGGGGLNGTINPPLGASAAGDRPALARGFAVVSTDSGHKGVVFDSSFMADQQAALDFAHNSLGTVTRVAKKLVTAYYGRPAAHAYMVGCSTGGREAMLAAERYPDLFDGIVAGSPAMRTGHSNIGTGFAAVAFNQAAPRDAAGLPIVAQAFSATDKALVLKGLLDACDAQDGLKDGVIENVKACHFRPAALACKGAKSDQCLSPAQVTAMEIAFAGPKDKAGNPAYSPFPYDTGIVAEGGGIPGLLPSAAPSPLGAPSRALRYDVDAALLKVRGDATQTLIDTAGWTNLSAFLGHAGKIIFYNGMSDPWFSAWDTADYYRRAGEANGADAWAASSRFYVMPGMGHCGGGANTFDNFDMLSAMVDWVEAGKAPGSIPASRRLPTAATRPLCPFPAYPHYKGAGDPALAASFECRLPAD